MTEDSTPSSDAGAQDELDEFRALVRAAFEQAQNSGKPDWDEMTSAVLKNRLLDMTDRQFSEARYGSPSFIHLVRRVPDLLEIIGDHPPFRLKINTPIVAITDSDFAYSSEGQTVTSKRAPVAPPEDDWRRVRIRDDLWRAILDYSSGDSYVLDPDTGYARSKAISDQDLPVVPTASREEFSSWRHEFIESLPPSLATRFSDDLAAWLDHGGRQTDLPRSIRGRWIEFLKRKVSGRLNHWFDVQGKLPPSDMLLISETGGLPPAEAIDEVVRTRQLRDLIIRAVRTMTYEELAKISLPSFALLRVSGRTSTHPRQDD